MGTFIKFGEDLIGVLLDLVLDLHLSTIGVLLFKGCVVKSEVFGVTSLGILEFKLGNEPWHLGITCPGGFTLWFLRPLCRAAQQEVSTSAVATKRTLVICTIDVFVNAFIFLPLLAGILCKFFV